MAICQSAPDWWGFNGRSTLRWPYFQNISDHVTIYGHCPWCMRPFDVNKNVPAHKSIGETIA